jgi:uncharacterized surface protein with fasciclin (FAS1) repeats
MHPHGWCIGRSIAARHGATGPTAATGLPASTDLADGMMAETVNGQSLEIKINDDGTVMVGDATVTTADIETSNGVIHVIDTVLVPPAQ